MNRELFMKQLDSLLHGISQSEREEAIQYYNDYFDDAGLENETDVIAALGTPAKVAEIIKAGLSSKGQDNFQFTDRGFESTYTHGRNEIALTEEDSQSKYNSSTMNGKKPMNPAVLILIILGVILLFPVWVPIVATIFGFTVAAIAIIFSLLLVAAILGVVFSVVGVALVAVGVVKLFIVPIASVALIGTGCLLAGLGILFLLATIWLCGKAIPAIFRGLIYIIRTPLRRKEGQMA